MATLQEYIKYSDLPHVLVVDDDDRIRELVARYLNEHGFLAVTAVDAIEAEKALRIAEFDILVVDVMMPGKSGLDFTQELRTYSDIPVILLTALGEVDDKVSGFESGADDYLPKPFDPRELVMRLDAILKRRPQRKTQKESYIIGPWQFAPQQSQITKGDKNVKLTDVETTLLKVLADRAEEVLSRDALAKLCDIEAGERTIDVQVTRLRRKIEEDTKNPRLLQTVRGRGYILHTGDVNE